uniref:Uncharacterized protein n=1 Tax=Rhodnius prolixus TaxID=13249 RepID=T1I562_RHOPR
MPVRGTTLTGPSVALNCLSVVKTEIKAMLRALRLSVADITEDYRLWFRERMYGEVEEELNREWRGRCPEMPYAVARLVTGHGMLRAKMFEMGLATDPYCACGDPETAEHIIMESGGGDLGDLIQLTFDTFTVGKFVSFTTDGCPDGHMAIQESERPLTGGQWCGSAWGYTVYYSETKSLNLTLQLDRLSEQ